MHHCQETRKDTSFTYGKGEMLINSKCQCRLCLQYFSEKEMSEEHYPARSVGNDDIVAIDLTKLFDSLQPVKMNQKINTAIKEGKTIKEVADKYFEDEISTSLYPAGRTAKTLCRQCNIFLGKYDEAYLKFFAADGNPKVVKGFQKRTRMEIIKAIFGKFLSVPEAKDEKFDFVDFVRDKSCTEYFGEWHLYFVRRNAASDLIGLADIGTGKIEYDCGIVYELSDEKFIFNLMNFEKHKVYEMNNIFDILSNNYSIVTGVGKDGGYHAQILLSRLFRSSEEIIKV